MPAAHFTLFECSGMPRLVRHIRLLWEATDAYLSLDYSDQENRERVNDEHRAHAVSALELVFAEETATSPQQ